MIPRTPRPSGRRRDGESAFAPGDGWRPLCLVLDDATLTDADTQTLLNFGHYPEIELIRTAPDLLPRLEFTEPNEDFVPIHALYEGGRNSLFWVWHAARCRERAQEVAAETSIDAEIAYRTIVLAAASAEMEADGFVTRSERFPLPFAARDALLLTPEDAMALIGLALRLHGNEGIGADLADLRLVGSTFHFVLARELTREGWRWFSGCVHSSLATRDDTAINLGQAALERLQRVLQIRDRMHQQAKLRSTPRAGDELVFQFETFMLFLSAAFDAAARVAHLVYFGSAYEEAGWRRGRWSQDLARVEPALAALTEDGTRGGATLKLISRMRNTIHGEALRTLTLQRGGAPTEHAVELSTADAEKTTDDIAALGGDPEAWGVRTQHARTYLAVDRYAEELLPHALELLNDLMRHTAVERLPAVTPGDLRQPPADTPSPRPLDDMFSLQTRSRVRQLGGL